MKGGAVTEQRYLRAGSPFRLRHGDKHLPGRPLAADVTVDLAIVGAGGSGALVADALVRTGRSVAALDRRGPVKGSTPARTALLQFEIDPAAMVASLWRSVLTRASCHRLRGGKARPSARLQSAVHLGHGNRAATGTALAEPLPARDTTPDFAWAGCVGASASGLPAIGAVPGAARCFAVIGYGGNGITFSVIAAQIIQRAILGLPDPDAELFALP